MGKPAASASARAASYFSRSSRRFSSAALLLPLTAFQFFGDGEQLGVGGFVRAGGPFAEVGRVVGVVDREHRPRVGDRAEAVDRLAADALRGAVGRDEIGMSGFEFAQLREELVVFAVGDGRRGVDVVATVVLANFVRGGVQSLVSTDLAIAYLDAGLRINQHFVVARSMQKCNTIVSPGTARRQVTKFIAASPTILRQFFAVRLSKDYTSPIRAPSAGHWYFSVGPSRRFLP